MDSEARSFGDWLRAELDRRSMTQADLARATGKNSGQVTNWLKGRRKPNSDACARIAAALDLDLDLVLAARGIRPLREPRRIYEVERLVRSAEQSLSQAERELRDALVGREVPIRFAGRVPASIECWSETLEDERMIDVPESVLGGRPPERVVVVEVSGDSLEGHRLVDGDYILCERLAPETHPPNGRIVAVRYGRRMLLGIWQRAGDWIELRDGEEAVIARWSIADDFVVEGVAFYRLGAQL